MQKKAHEIEPAAHTRASDFIYSTFKFIMVAHLLTSKPTQHRPSEYQFHRISATASFERRGYNFTWREKTKTASLCLGFFSSISNPLMS
jgi:hypothetical protein